MTCTFRPNFMSAISFSFQPAGLLSVINKCFNTSTVGFDSLQSLDMFSSLLYSADLNNNSHFLFFKFIMLKFSCDVHTSSEAINKSLTKCHITDSQPKIKIKHLSGLLAPGHCRIYPNQFGVSPLSSAV